MRIQGQSSKNVITDICTCPIRYSEYRIHESNDERDGFYPWWSKPNSNMSCNALMIRHKENHSAEQFSNIFQYYFNPRVDLILMKKPDCNIESNKRSLAVFK